MLKYMIGATYRVEKAFTVKGNKVAVGTKLYAGFYGTVEMVEIDSKGNLTNNVYTPTIGHAVSLINKGSLVEVEVK